MATITRYYLADFGPRYTGLATVGYTLPGGSRTTSGVSELAAGTGIYGASITHADTISGALMWDTGGGSPVYASEEINTLAGYKLASDGLDSIPVETGVNARQAMSVTLAAAAGVISGASNNSSMTITVKAAANSSTTRIVATADRYGNRSAMTLTLPS